MGTARATRLCIVLYLRWVHIEAAYYQIDLLKQSPARLVRLTYAWLLQHTAPDKVNEIEEWLNSPLDEEDDESEDTIEYESSSFLAMQQKTRKA